MERQDEKPFESIPVHKNKPLKDKWYFKKDNRHSSPSPRIDIEQPHILVISSLSELAARVFSAAVVDPDVGNFYKPFHGWSKEMEPSCGVPLVQEDYSSQDLLTPFQGSMIAGKKERSPDLKVHVIGSSFEKATDQVLEDSHSGIESSFANSPVEDDSVTDINDLLLTSDEDEPVVEAKIEYIKYQSDLGKINDKSVPSKVNRKTSEVALEHLNLIGSIEGAVPPLKETNGVSISEADLWEETKYSKDDKLVTLDNPSSKTKNARLKRKPSKGTKPKALKRKQEKTSERMKLKILGLKLRRRLFNVRRTCRKCLEKSSTYSMNINHEQLEHLNICQICTDAPFSFICISDLKRHKEEMHSDESLEAVSQKNIDIRTWENVHLTKKISEDVAIVAVMPKILRRNYTCERVIKEDVKILSLKNDHKNRSNSNSNSGVEKDDLNNEQTVKTENFRVKLKSDKHVDFNKNEYLPDDGSLKIIPLDNFSKAVSKPTTHEIGTSWKMKEIEDCDKLAESHNSYHNDDNQPKQPLYKVTVPLTEGAVIDAGPIDDYMINMRPSNILAQTTNLTASTIATLGTVSIWKTSPSVQLETSSTASSPKAGAVGIPEVKISNPMNGGITSNIKDRMIHPPMRGRGGVKTRGGSAVPLIRGMRPRMQTVRGVRVHAAPPMAQSMPRARAAPLRPPRMPRARAPPLRPPSMHGARAPPFRPPSMPGACAVPHKPPNMPGARAPPLRPPSMPGACGPPLRHPSMPGACAPPFRHPSMPGARAPPFRHPSMPGACAPPLRHPSKPTARAPPLRPPSMPRARPPQLRHPSMPGARPQPPRPPNMPRASSRPQLLGGGGGVRMPGVQRPPFLGVPGGAGPSAVPIRPRGPQPEYPKQDEHPKQISAARIPMESFVPVDPANMPPAPQPKIIKLEPIDISDEETQPPAATNNVLDHLKACGISVIRKTPTNPRSLELPPGISLCPASMNSKDQGNN